MDYWNIGREAYPSFSSKMQRYVRRQARSDIIYSKDERNIGKKKYPLLIASGTHMTRKTAYRLLRFYCNRNSVFYSAGDLDDIVDSMFGGTESDGDIVNLNAYAKMKAIEEYRKSLRVSRYSSVKRRYSSCQYPC